MKTSTRN